MLNLLNLNGVPAFTLANQNPNLERVHGAVYVKNTASYVFPAYPPFGPIVLADLQRVMPGLERSPEVDGYVRYLDLVPDYIKNRTLPEGTTFVTKPFDHQVDGLTRLFYNPRYALFWEAGSGKSKPIVDLIRMLPGQRMLVLTAKVNVDNWVKEAGRHSGGTIAATTVHGDPGRNRETIRGYKRFDLLSTTYSTARNLGFPRLYKKVFNSIKAVTAKGVKLSTSGLQELVRGVRVFSDPEDQQTWVEKWAAGMPIAQLRREAEALAKLTPQWLCDIDYQIIVADESQAMIDPRSQQSKVALALSKKAARRYLLTGTPTLGDPRHLHAQLNFLSPALMPESWPAFSEKFLVHAPWNKRIVTGFRNIDVINARVQRIGWELKKEDCLDLPDRTIIDIPVELSTEAKKLYNDLIDTLQDDFKEYVLGDDTLSIQNTVTLINKLSQVTSGFVLANNKDTKICNGCPHLARCVDGGISPYTDACQVVQEPPPTELHTVKENAKLEAFEELMGQLLANPKAKIIVWGIFRAELDMLEAVLQKLKVGYVRMDGSSSGKAQTKVDRFNNEPDCRVWLGQEATGVGITLNSATFVCYFNYDWSLGTYLQSIDRNYRVGQTQKVTVWRLVAKGSIDEYKLAALDQKKDISRMLTSKLACVTCPHQVKCLNAGVELFDPDCIHKRSTLKPHAEVRKIT